MKTTSNRIHRNGATKPAVSQCKTSRLQTQEEKEDQARIDAEFADPEEGYPSCLAIYDRESKGLVEKIPLSEEEFLAVLMLTAGCKNDAPHFFASAIREKLARIRAESERVARAFACAGAGN